MSFDIFLKDKMCIDCTTAANVFVCVVKSVRYWFNVMFVEMRSVMQ